MKARGGFGSLGRISRRALLQWTVMAMLGVAGLTLVGCGDDDTDGEPPALATATTVDVTLRDFAIATGRASAAAGDVAFVATNEGPSAHEFVIVRSDLTADSLPMSDDGTKVDEDGEGILTIPGKIGEFAAGLTETTTASLPAGRYILICNIPGHYALGMFVEFTVT